MALDYLTATPAANEVVECTKTCELMDQMLSSMSEFWVPYSSWLECRELQIQPAFWNVTLAQWTSAWNAHKLERQQDLSSSPTVIEREMDVPPSEPTVLSKNSLDMIKAQYGACNPYAWSIPETQATKQTDNQESALASEELPEAAQITEISEHTEVPPRAPSSSLEAITCSNQETSLASCATGVPSSSHVNDHNSSASDDRHARLSVEQDCEQLHRQLEDYSSISMVVEAGHAAQRKRGRMPTEPLEDIAWHPVSAISQGHTLFKHTETFIVNRVRRFSISNQEEIVAYTPSPKAGIGSLLKTAGRIMRGIHL
ncbi:uncharacterized protein N0V89_008230 [Didymosphaeria variabile]|uniref:Uncharacterized protein n=1 Tax=Didymosphaeria variabile TaxID=1932322 RepID=A0A9W8XFD0_9PLEO|nr:uncharacterized protein N0V89_008230 [Didymosphaeria variabile]KAJ4349614.1 hypothetical protein N0V89_008230 [Didymosphaeria variabile]